MIRQVIAKIDCGDWCCNACKWREHNILTNTDVCQLFNQQVFDSDTFSSKGHKERCDACKQAEAQLMQPLYIQLEDARHNRIQEDQWLNNDPRQHNDWVPPTLEQLKEKHNELEKKLGISSRELHRGST